MKSIENEIKNEMKLVKSRYGGRIVGIIDGLGMKYSNLTPEEYYHLSEAEREKFSSNGVARENCYGVIDSIQTAALRANDALTAQEYIKEYKIGLREGLMMVRHNKDLMNLVLPISFWIE